MMINSLELHEKIKTPWLNRVTQYMARGAGIRADFRDQLERFYGLLGQVLETGDNAWLDPLIFDWASSLTQTDLEVYRTNLISIIKEIMVLTIDVCRDNLSQGDAIELISEFAPCFAYAFDKAAEYEMQVKVNYLSTQLTSVKQNLERLERSKSDFIAVAAHELKTPLTLVDGYSAMLHEALSPLIQGSPACILLDGINNGTRRLQIIIDDMIDVSLIDNDLLALNFQPVWFNRLFDVLTSELSEFVRERKQILEIIDFPGCNEMTFGDPERLMQVFRNILTNAIKFTPDGGTIKVTGRKLPGFIEIVVSDTGIGISVDNQQEIFDRFSQLGNTSLHSSGKTKFKGGGPGLGLHIAKGIVEAHGGAIWVESPGFDEERCPGSTFHILLPLKSEPPDDRTAKLFSPLVQSRITESKIDSLE
jgi:signal transduction histidine kinase